MKKQLKELPNWLKEQQYISWQLEILIAGGLVVTLFQLPELITQFLVRINDLMTVNGQKLTLIFAFLMVSRTLLIGFSVNLLLRVIWLAFMGINFVFPNDINYEQLGYNNHFKKRFERSANGNYRLLRLEQICSLSFSIAVLLSFIFIGLLFLIAIIFPLLSGGFLDRYIYFPYVLVALMFFITIGGLDRFIFGWLKKYPRIAKTYYPISRFLSIISLSFIYRREWLTLLSNTKRWSIHLMVTIYFSIAFIVSIDDVSKTLGESDIFPTFFKLDQRKYTNMFTSNQIQLEEHDNLRPEGMLVSRSSIQSDIIDNGIVRLFMNYPIWWDNHLEYFFEKHDFKPKWEEGVTLPKNDSLFQVIINERIMVIVDRKDTLQSLHWLHTTHPNTDQVGFTTYINVDSLRIGQHELWMQICGYSDYYKGEHCWHSNYIPFYKK
ncbi:MAG: hypothetical protein AAF806_21250 [Bacteroidota bacterium]